MHRGENAARDRHALRHEAELNPPSLRIAPSLQDFGLVLMLERFVRAEVSVARGMVPERVRARGVGRGSTAFSCGSVFMRERGDA